MQRPESFAWWYEQTPADFVFSVKGSRYATHMLTLKNVEGAKGIVDYVGTPDGAEETEQAIAAVGGEGKIVQAEVTKMEDVRSGR